MSVGPEPIVHDRAVSRLFGVMLMVVGALIMALCGLCSLGVVGYSIYQALRFPMGFTGMIGMFPLVGIFGGVPIAIGFGVFALGRALYRGPKRSA